MSGNVTVVIPAFGGGPRLRQLLEALAAQADKANPLPVLVSDDASPVPIADELGDYDSLALEVVRSGRNGGPGAARNHAVARVNSRWVAFLDSDTVPATGWLAAVNRVVSEDSLDVVEGPVIIPGTATPFTHATETQVPGLQHVSCNLVVRVDLLREIGGFDERFYDPARKLHFREDTDLFFRLEDIDARIGWEPELVVLHPPLPSSFGAPLRLARRYHFDPLLSREHTERFAEFNRGRMLGPVTLRSARHSASLFLVGGTLVAGLGGLMRNRVVVRAALGAAVVGWISTAAGLSWRRRVRPSDVGPLACVAAATPWVYLWHYYRGVARFQHRPRL